MQQDDRKYHKILWCENRFVSVKTFELNTVTYGTSSALFLTVRALQQLTDYKRAICPEAANIIKRDFYVNDLNNEYLHLRRSGKN